MHNSSHTVLYDPDGLVTAELPLDREPYESILQAVLAWIGGPVDRRTDEDTLAIRDYEQIGLQLTSTASLANQRRGCRDSSGQGCR